MPPRKSLGYSNPSPLRSVTPTDSAAGLTNTNAGGLFGGFGFRAPAPVVTSSPTPRTPSSPAVEQKDAPQTHPSATTLSVQNRSNTETPDESSASESDATPVVSPRLWGPPPTIGGHDKGLPEDATLGDYAERSHALLEILKDLHSTG